MRARRSVSSTGSRTQSSRQSVHSGGVTVGATKSRRGIPRRARSSRSASHSGQPRIATPDSPSITTASVPDTTTMCCSPPLISDARGATLAITSCERVGRRRHHVGSERNARAVRAGPPLRTRPTQPRNHQTLVGITCSRLGASGSRIFLPFIDGLTTNQIPPMMHQTATVPSAL